MFKRIICLLVLVSFVLVKHTSLLLPGQKANVIAADYTSTDQDAYPEAEKESKEPLKSYDEYLHELPLMLFASYPSTMPVSVAVIRLSKPYLTLPYTPPDLRV